MSGDLYSRNDHLSEIMRKTIKREVPVKGKISCARSVICEFLACKSCRGL